MNKNRLCSMACGVDKMYKIDRLDAKRFFIEGSKKIISMKRRKI